jgi:hypothetical protein
MAGWYRSGRCALGEGQNPKAPAVKREAEEDWGRQQIECYGSTELQKKRTAVGRVRSLLHQGRHSEVTVWIAANLAVIGVEGAEAAAAGAE